MSSKTQTPTESRASSVKPDEGEKDKDTKDKDKDKADGGAVENGQTVAFPSATEVNGRLRRLIAAYQRDFRLLQSRRAAREREERRERMEQAIRDREQQRQEAQQRKWTSREDADFLRTVLAFGVEYSRKERRYVWERFRQLARLDKKNDDVLTEYFVSFIAMCKRRAGRKLSSEEGEIFSTVQPLL